MHARFYAPSLVVGARSVELPADEAEHLSRVLRLRAGAEVRVFDGRGHEFEGRVHLAERARAVVTLGEALPPSGAEPPVPLALAQALLKGDAMDRVIRDAVMLGVTRVIPLETGRSEMPAKRVQASGRVARWRRIAVASVKQCGRAVVPEVSEPQGLAECLRSAEGMARYLLAEPALELAEPAAVAPPPAARPVAGALLCVGPEGGWTPDELAAALAAGCVPLTLGPRTLRADSAAIVGLTALQCLFGDFARHDADYWIRTLRLAPHPEGGHFAETYRSAGQCVPASGGGQCGGPRPCATAIYFLLRGSEFSALHRLRSDEMWHFHAGSGASIVMLAPDGTLGEARIGPDPDRRQTFQVLIPAGTWFGATVEDPASYTLVGCTVSPGFAYEDFELASRAGLVAAYPQHREVIERLTRA